jgi:arginine N-succinyltransferase
MSADTDSIRTIRESREMEVGRIGPVEGQKMMVASGRLRNFAACYAYVSTSPEGVATIDPEAAARLGVQTGSRFLATGR